MAEPGQVILAVGVDQRRHLGQTRVGLVMVHHHRLGAVRAGDRERLDAGRPAVDRDDQLRAVPGEALDSRGVGAVAFGHAVGDVGARLEAVRAQEMRDEGARAGAVHVVVAEHRDLLAALDRIGKPGGPLVHVAQAAGVRHQRLDAGIEHDRNLVEADPARRQHAAQELRQGMALADGDGCACRGRIEALAPEEAARGGADAEVAGLARLRRPWLANRPHCPRPQPCLPRRRPGCATI